MNDPEETTNVDCELSHPQSPCLENNYQLANNSILANDNTNSSKNEDPNSNSENQTLMEVTDVCFENVNVAPETNLAVSTDNSIPPPLPPLPKDDKELPQPTPAAYSADYNAQNYANYNYMYNYNNYYGYPYPQYQWDYNSQQYYQPYQNYYNYNYNANQVQTSKPPPPPPDAVQLPVEEKPVNKTNTTTVDDSNRYSPTVETDDDDNMKGLSENNKSDVLVEHPAQTTPSEQIQQNMVVESIENKTHQPIVPSNIPVQQPIVPTIAQIQPYNIPVQQPSYLINPQIQIQSTEGVQDLTSQQQNSTALNGKDDSVEKVSKASTVLGKNQAKKRLMAFSMMKQKLQEQNNSTNDNQGSDVGEGNDVEFVPELNVFQTVSKKKVVTNKKVVKVIKAQQTIEQIEEMKKDELLQGNNAALYQHLLRNGGNEAPILQKLGIESLAEKYSAKIREQDKRFKRHHHRRRDDDRRSHKYHRRSHSKSRSRSKDKPKMRALEVKSWKDFLNSGFTFDIFHRFKKIETEETKEKERKSRTKKRHGDSRSDGKNHNTETTILLEAEKENGDQKSRYNLLDGKREPRKCFKVTALQGDALCTKDIPSYIIQHTKSKPVIKYSQNPAKATCHFQSRRQMFATLLPEIEAIVHEFFSSMRPKKLKESLTDNLNDVDEKLLAMMQDENIYPFKGWWPKLSFIVTEVKEDRNVEVDKDALINEFTTSKRTKKSRFDNDDTSVVDLRPTVPSKWDDYDSSPVTDKVIDVEVSQNVEINTNDVSIINNREKNNRVDVIHQEETMDIVMSNIGQDEPKVDDNDCSVIPTIPQESQIHAKLDTEYEEFLKIVTAEKNENNITAQNDNENSLSTKLVSLNDESIHDESIYDESIHDESMHNESIHDESIHNESVHNESIHNESIHNESIHDEFQDDTSNNSSDESVSLHDTAEELLDRSFVQSISSIDTKVKRKKKSSNKKSKKIKKKESKKKKHKSSSSESSQDSESDSDSSSEDSDSETTDSTSTVEKKKKKKKSKDKKKKNNKKKHKSDKNKSNKKSEDEKNESNSILNLIEKAFNVEIKNRPFNSEESKQKRRKRKHDKKEYKSNEENENELEKVKECLKETFTKLVKNDKIGNQSLSCDDSRVSDVLKYFKMEEENDNKKNKKLKKSLKRKLDSDISDDEKTTKKSRVMDYNLKPEDIEKKKKKKKKSSGKKSVDSDDRVSRKKSKKKSKTSDTSETEDGGGSKHKKTRQDNNSEHFFGQRPNDWNMKNKSSMRGVVHHSDVKNIALSSKNVICISKLDDNIKKKKESKSHHSSYNNSCTSDSGKNKRMKSRSPDILVEYVKKIKKGKQLEILDESLKNDVSNNIVEKNTDNEGKHNIGSSIVSNKSYECDDTFKLQNDLPQIVSPTKDNNEQQDLIKDLNNVLKPNESKIFNENDELTTFIKPMEHVKESISYRDQVKMNLKKLSNSPDIPFLFGFSSSLGIMKSNNLKIDKIKDDVELPKEEIKPEIDETKCLKFVDRPKVVICPQTQKKKSNVVKSIPPKIDVEANNEVVLNQRFSQEDSKDEYSDNSSVPSPNTSSDEDEESDEESEMILENDFLNYNANQQYKNEPLLNDNVLNRQHQYSFGKTETINSDSENEEQVSSINVEHTVAQEKITHFSNSSELSMSEQHFDESNQQVVLQNDNTVEIMSSEKNDFDSICSHNTKIDLDDDKNESISQWMFDWNQLEKSVTEINNSEYCRSNDDKSRKKKKSRWDEQVTDDIIVESRSIVDAEKEIKTNMSDYTTEKLKSTSSLSNVDTFSEEQYQPNEITSINSVNESTEYNYYSESWCNEYEDQQYSCIPEYSQLKTIDDHQLSPVDYSIYENYNPDYDYNGEDYENQWRSIDTTDQFNTILTAGEASFIPVDENVLEILPSSDDISHVENEPSKDTVNAFNENVCITSNIQDISVKLEKSDSDCHNEAFSQLYQQYFQHYNQNPIKYSVADPVFTNITEIKVSVPEESPSRETFSDTDQESIDNIPIPLRERAYIIMLKDNVSKVYYTSDNYIAYCAIDDKCMVHIAKDCTSLDGVEIPVRHCFNIYDGEALEYWLNADLIPFYIPSNPESGVVSDDDDNSVESDSDSDIDNNEANNDANNNDESDDDSLVGIEFDVFGNDIYIENNDRLLNDHRVIEKYGENNFSGIEQTVTDINQEEMSNSSEYDSDASDSSVTFTKMCSTKINLIVNPFQISHDTKNNINKCQDVVDVNMSVDQQTNNENSDLHADIVENVIPDQIIPKVEYKCCTDDIFEANLPSVLKTDDNISIGEEIDYKKESVVSPKKSILQEDLVLMNILINQRRLIQRLKIRSKEKIQEKLPDTVLVCYSDNMESVKHPFLGKFQPPTISILSKQQNTKICKRVIYADGIYPGEDLAAFPTHDDSDRLWSPPPLKALFRESLHGYNPFKRPKTRTKVTMVNKKEVTTVKSLQEVATVNPMIQCPFSEELFGYFVKNDSPKPIATETIVRSDNSPNNSDICHRSNDRIPSSRLSRDATPVPLDNCWNNNV